MFAFSDAEVLSGPATMVAAEHMKFRRDMCAHTHGFALIALVTAGKGTHFTEEGTQPLREGSLLLLGPNSWHSYGSASGLEVTLLYLGRRLVDFAPRSPLEDTLGPLLSSLGRDGSVTARSLGPREAEELFDSFDRIVHQPKRTVLGQIASLYDLLDQLVTVCTRSEPLPLAPLTHEHARVGESMLRHNARVSHAVSLLHDQLECRWSLEKLASKLNISPSQLTRDFRADLHLGPMAYLQQLRAERMAYLLRTTDLAISTAGRAVGWLDPSYASRRFSAHWGVPPLGYRSRSRP